MANILMSWYKVSFKPTASTEHGKLRREFSLKNSMNTVLQARSPSEAKKIVRFVNADMKPRITKVEFLRPVKYKGS